MGFFNEADVPAWKSSKCIQRRPWHSEWEGGSFFQVNVWGSQTLRFWIRYFLSTKTEGVGQKTKTKLKPSNQVKTSAFTTICCLILRNRKTVPWTPSECSGRGCTGQGVRRHWMFQLGPQRVPQPSQMCLRSLDHLRQWEWGEYWTCSSVVGY